MNKNKIFISLFIVTVILITSGCFVYFNQKKQTEDLTNRDVISNIEREASIKCGNGDWTEFPDYAKKGNFLRYSADTTVKATMDEKFTNADGSVFLTTDENYSLAFFTEKEVRVEGIEIGSAGKKEVYVKRIKCTGKEANRNIQTQRQNLMKYISANIDSVAPEKSAANTWEVENFYFYNDSDVYVEYQSPSSIAEDTPYDEHIWLIRVSDLDKNVPKIETLAYIQEDRDDPDKNVVKTGKDIYSDADNLTAYSFDVDAKEWVLQ